MPSLFLLTPGTHVSLQSRALRLEIPARDEEPALDRTLPLVEIERVIIGDTTQATTAVLAALMELDIPVTFCSWSGRVLGLLRPPSVASAGARLEQYRRGLDPGFCLAQAQSVIEAKILNQRRILQRLAANRGLDVNAATDWFNALIQHTGRAPSPDTLRGLDPALGFYHTTEDRRASLALDLLEPFRAPICDALAVDLFSHEMLNADHFERRLADSSRDSQSPGCFLTLPGRKKFFVQYERRLERQFTYEFTGQRTTLRQLIERQCLDLKKTILEGETFIPFLMN